MSNLTIEGVQNSPLALGIGTKSSDDKFQTSLREDAPSVNRSSPSSQNDASPETSETPTVWMWVLTFVAGISGVSEF